MKPKLKFFTDALTNNRGIALVTVLVASVCLCLVASAHLTNVTKEAGLAHDQVVRAQSLYSAESGINYAKLQLKTANWNTTTGWSNVADGAGSTNNITFSYNAGLNQGAITSVSNYQGQQKTLVAVVSRITSGGPIASPFDKAACSCGNLTLGGSGNVDSYNSAVGAYTAATATSNGHLGSNGTLTISGSGLPKGNVNVSGNVTMTGSADVIGNLDTSSSLTMSGSAKVRGNVTTKVNLSGGWSTYIYGTAMIGGANSFRIANITGGVIPGTPPAISTPCNCTAIPLGTLIPAAATSNNNSNIPGAYLSGTSFAIGGNNNLTLNAGTYYFTNFKVGGSAKVSIGTGPVIIYMTNLDDSHLGSFNIGGSGIYNTTTPDKVKIYSNATGTSNLGGSGSFIGTVYAPSSTFNLTGSGAICGAVLANTVSMGGSGDFHYDTKLATATEPVAGGTGTVTVQVVSWSQS